MQTLLYKWIMDTLLLWFENIILQRIRYQLCFRFVFEHFVNISVSRDTLFAILISFDERMDCDGFYEYVIRFQKGVKFSLAGKAIIPVLYNKMFSYFSTP